MQIEEHEDMLIIRGSDDDVSFIASRLKSEGIPCETVLSSSGRTGGVSLVVSDPYRAPVRELIRQHQDRSVDVRSPEEYSRGQKEILIYFVIGFTLLAALIFFSSQR